MNFAITIVSPPDFVHSQCFQETAETLCWGLQSLGHSTVITDQPNLPDRRHIVLGANLLQFHPQEIRPDSIIYNLEQAKDNPWISDSYLSLLKTHKVWDYSNKNRFELERMGVENITVVPIGYAPTLTRIETADHQDIDVFFAGAVNDRRTKILNGLISEGLRVVSVCGVYGGERDALISRSKVTLNLHFFDAKVFEIVRISYLLANRCAVLSEWSGHDQDAEDLKDGVCFATYDELVSAAVRLCNDPIGRENLSLRGFEAIRKRDIVRILADAITA